MNTGKVRVAVATRNGERIDEHFGQADLLDVYEVTPGLAVLIERRAVENYCQGGAGDEDKRELILRTIADCQAVFAARIGEGPRRRLKDAVIEPVDAFAYEPVVAALLSWSQGKPGPQSP